MKVNPEWLITQKPAGSAIYTLIDVGAGREVAFFLREESTRIAGYTGPDIEIRAAIFPAGNVALMPILLRVGAESPENIWETWYNYYAPDMPELLRTWSRQPRVCVVFYGDTGKRERQVECVNSWGPDFRYAYQYLVLQPSWSMQDFNAAREILYAKYETVWDLWRAIFKN